MSHHAPTPIDPAEAARAQAMWNNVTAAAKWGVVTVVAFVGLLGAIFIHW